MEKNKKVKIKKIEKGVFFIKEVKKTIKKIDKYSMLIKK